MHWCHKTCLPWVQPWYWELEFTCTSLISHLVFGANSVSVGTPGIRYKQIVCKVKYKICLEQWTLLKETLLLRPVNMSYSDSWIRVVSEYRTSPVFRSHWLKGYSAESVVQVTKWTWDKNIQFSKESIIQFIFCDLHGYFILPVYLRSCIDGSRAVCRIGLNYRVTLSK